MNDTLTSLLNFKSTLSFFSCPSSPSCLSFKCPLQPSDVICSLLACPLHDLPGTLSSPTFFWIHPRCGLWPERWNSCTITQTDYLLPVLVLLSCCQLELHQRKMSEHHSPSLSPTVLSEGKQDQTAPPLPFRDSKLIAMLSIAVLNTQLWAWRNKSSRPFTSWTYLMAMITS